MAAVRADGNNREAELCLRLQSGLLGFALKLPVKKKKKTGVVCNNFVPKRKVREQ